MKKRIISIGLVIILCVGLFAGLAIPASASDDYPQEYKNNPLNNAMVDRWKFYARQCTSFVAWCLESRNGVSNFSNWYGGAHFGDANSWDDAARQIGIKVDSNPAVGAVAQTDSGETGHVAWVSAVNGDYVIIEEYNWGTVGGYGTRTVHKSQFNYIHIKDIVSFPMPTTSAQITNGVYAIQHKGSGKYVSASCNGNPGDQLFIYSDPSAPYDDQKFYFERLSDNTYKIVSIYDFQPSSRVIDVINGGTGNGTPVIQYTYTGGSNQRWYIVDAGGGYYWLIPQYTNKAMDVNGNGTADGTKIQLWERNDTDAQKFKLIPTKPSVSVLTSISVATQPTKTSFEAHEVLDTTGLTLKATYNDGSTKTITSGFTCSPATFTPSWLNPQSVIVGNKTEMITVTYEGKTATFSVNVWPTQYTSFSIFSCPDKTVYTVGETLSTSGLSLSLEYKDGTSVIVTEATLLDGFVCSPTTLSAAGTQKITVYFIRQTQTFDVTVNLPGDVGDDAESVSISGQVRSYNPKLATTITLYNAGTTNVITSTTIAVTTGTGQITQGFSLNSVPAGTYDLVVTKGGHLEYKITNVIVADADIDLTASAKGYSTINLLAGDINGDGRVNVQDVTFLLNEYNKAPSIYPYADIDGNGTINVQDVTYLLVNFNKTNFTIAF